MSKLRERIRRLGRREGAPLGFATAKAARTSASLLLVALVDEATPPTAALEAGADGVLVRAGAKPNAAALKDVWWGVVSRGGPPAADAAGADYAVIDATVPLESLAPDRGIVIAVDEGWSDAMLRATDAFSPDALYAGIEEPPTTQRLLELRRLSSLGGPVLVEVAVELDATALGFLRDAGVVGVVVPPARHDSLGELRRRLDALPAQRRRGDDRPDAILPSAGPIEADEDDD